MTRFHVFRMLVLSAALLPQAASVTMKQPQPAVTPDGENAMAKTYGFLRTASNDVGNTVQGVLNVEGSLTDMKKDLDEEYSRWQVKKKALLGDESKLNAETARLKSMLLQQKDEREQVKRIQGEIAAEQAINVKKAGDNKEAEQKRALDRKGMEEDIEALQCATKTIQQAKQAAVDAANKKSALLKEQNRGLQEQVFNLNKDLTILTNSALKQNISNEAAVSGYLAEVQALQKQIHGLENELVGQAQLEEMVQRTRERLVRQSAETVKQREKLTQAQAQCMETKKRAIKQIEEAKHNLNVANNEMVQCQNLDAQNQQLQATLNDCINRKRR